MTEVKKKRVDSKNKGNGFENKIAKELTNCLEPLTFIRTPGSGARVGGVNFGKFGKLFSGVMDVFTGDVICTNEKDNNVCFRFNLELKFYKECDNFNSLFSGSAHVYAWLEESRIDAAKVGKTPLLIFKFNRTPTYVALDINQVLDQDEFLKTIPPDLVIKRNDQLIHLFDFERVKQDKLFWTR